MKIIVQQIELLETLGVVGKAISNNPPLPILNGVLLKTENGKVFVYGTDLYFGIKSELKADIENEGELVLPAKELRQIVNNLNPSSVVIEKKDENTVQITAQKNNFTIQVQKAKDFPSFPNKPDKNAFLSTKTLELITQLTCFNASTDQTKPVLTGVLFNQTREACEVITTDGFRLSKLIVEPILDDVGKLILPAKSILEIYRTVAKEKTAGAVMFSSVEQKQLVFSVNQHDFYIRLIDGEFPPYEKIIPQDFKALIQLDLQEFKEKLKGALVFSESGQSFFKIETELNKLQLKSSSQSLGSYSCELENAKPPTSGVQIAFNTQYVLDFLKAVENFGVKETQIEIKVMDSIKPAIFVCPDIQNYTHVVMPFRINQ